MLRMRSRSTLLLLAISCCLGSLAACATPAPVQHPQAGYVQALPDRPVAAVPEALRTYQPRETGSYQRRLQDFFLSSPATPTETPRSQASASRSFAIADFGIYMPEPRFDVGRMRTA